LKFPYFIFPESRAILSFSLTWLYTIFSFLFHIVIQDELSEKWLAHAAPKLWVDMPWSFWVPLRSALHTVVPHIRPLFCLHPGVIFGVCGHNPILSFHPEKRSTWKQ
jgi:hypothetical protein